MTSSNINEKIGFIESEVINRKKKLLELRRKAQGNVATSNEKEVNTENPCETKIEITTSSPSDNSKSETPKNMTTSDELDLSNLAFRKIDWDLKRGIAKSLEILQNRTNEVIVEIIRERTEMTKETDD